MATTYKTIKIPKLPASASPYDKETARESSKSPRKEKKNAAKNVNCNNNQSQRLPPEGLEMANKRITEKAGEKPQKLIGWDYPKVLQTKRAKTPSKTKSKLHKRSEVDEINKLVNKKM